MYPSYTHCVLIGLNDDYEASGNQSSSINWIEYHLEVL